MPTDWSPILWGLVLSIPMTIVMNLVSARVDRALGTVGARRRAARARTEERRQALAAYFNDHPDAFTQYMLEHTIFVIIGAPLATAGSVLLTLVAISPRPYEVMDIVAGLATSVSFVLGWAIMSRGVSSAFDMSVRVRTLRELPEPSRDDHDLSPLTPPASRRG